MAQPTPYSPTHDFTDYQSDNPSDPLPGGWVDSEFGALGLTTGQILTNLAKIQADDGSLRSGSVTYDTFSASLQAALAVSPQIAALNAQNYAAAALVSENNAEAAAVIATTQAGIAVGSASAAQTAQAAAESAAAGIKWRPSARAATTTNITLTGLQTVDGVVLAVGDRVLVKNQSVPAQNGVYTVATGNWPRATDANTWSELVALCIAVEEGTNGDYTFICTVDNGGTIGTTAVTFTTFRVILADGSVAFVKLGPDVAAGLAPLILTNGSVPYGALASNVPTGLQPALASGWDWNGTNLLVNGETWIDQRNGSAATTPSGTAYLIDRWKLGANVGGKFTAQQVSDAPPGFTSSLKLTSTSAYAPSAGDFFYIQQPVEGAATIPAQFGLPTAQPLTTSFWVKASIAGTYMANLYNTNSVKCFNFTYTVNAANTWEKKTFTFPADTANPTNVQNGIGFNFNFGLGGGTTYQGGQSGAWAVGDLCRVTGGPNLVANSGATLQVSGCKLEIGNVATPWKRVTYRDSFAECERYYQIIRGGYRAFNVPATTNMFVVVNYRTWMRAPPGTVTLVNPSYSNANSASYNNAGNGSIEVVATSVSAGTADYKVDIRLDAEL